MRRGFTGLVLSLAVGLALLPTGALAMPAMSGMAGESIEWKYDYTVIPSTITFSGSGPMDDYASFGVSHGWNSFSKTSVIIEEGITHVGDRTLGGNSCTSVTIASTVESIGSFAFSNCKSLITVNIDNPNIAIAENAFQDCEAITSFVVGGKEYNTPTAYFEAFKENYTSPDGTTVIGPYTFMNNADLRTAVLREGVKTIDIGAFSGCSNLRSVTFPSSLTTIELNAFRDCGSLETVALPEGLTALNNSAFHGCNSLKSVTLPSTLTTMGDHVFENCAALETVALGEGSKAVPNKAFKECTGLKNVVLPSTLTSIGDYAFQGCTALETVIVPEGVTTIGADAFHGCTNLKSVTLPYTVTTIEGNAFQDYTSLESIQLPDSLETLGDTAFQGCSSLTSLTIPKNVTHWGRSTFAACTGLTQLTLSQGLTTIGDSAFYNCPGLTSVAIPDSMTSIGDYAFRATGLTGVTLPQSVTYLGENPFGVTGLGRDDFEWVTDFTITGYAGTEAEAYAKTIGFPFVDLTPAPDPTPTPSSSGSSGSSSSSRHSHSWDDGVVTLEPTDLTSGLRTYTCKGCGATRTESISAGWAAPVIGKTVPLTGTPNSKDPAAGLRVISSTGTNPDELGGQAYASTQSVEVDGKAVEFEMYALKDEKGNDTNYVKLRDVALVIDGTEAQCNVDWVDGYVTVTTHTPYEPNGSEMKTPFTGDRDYGAANGVTKIDGESVLMQAFVLVDDNGGGYTYYKLRDLGQALGFNVGWSSEKGVYIETDRPYDPAN